MWYSNMQAHMLILSFSLFPSSSSSSSSLSLSLSLSFFDTHSHTHTHIELLFARLIEVAQWQHVGLLVNWSTDRSYTRGMIHNKVIPLDEVVPGPIQPHKCSRGLQQQSFIIMSVCLYMCLSVHFLPLYRLYPSIGLSHQLCIYVFICPLFCLSVCLSVYLPVYPSTYFCQ